MKPEDTQVWVVVACSWPVMVGVGAILPQSWQAGFQTAADGSVRAVVGLGEFVKDLVGLLPADWPAVGVVSSGSAFLFGVLAAGLLFWGLVKVLFSQAVRDAFSNG